MYQENQINQLFLRNKRVKSDWQNLLKQEGIERFEQEEMDSLDRTFGIYMNDSLVATVSQVGNLIKYIAIREEAKEEGKTFNRLVSHVRQLLASEGIFQTLVVTKPLYQQSFEYLGFKVIAKTEDMVFLETGTPNINTFLEKIPQVKGKNKASIVMNANPFTKGHYELVRRASLENDWVYVFVLESKQPMFTPEERLSLVKQGVSEFDNVIVIQGGDYIISPATFPVYFLRKNDESTTSQTRMDLSVFKHQIASYLGINHRYVGEEPFSPMTETYNHTMAEMLGPEIDLKIIPRVSTLSGDVISATKVRKAIQVNRIDYVKDMLPLSTYLFLCDKDNQRKRVETNENN